MQNNLVQQSPSKVPQPWKPSQTLQAMTEWKAYEPVPKEATQGQLSTWMEELRQATQPATDSQFRSELARLIEFSMAFGIPHGDPAKAQKIYHQVLSHLPADVLHSAISRVLSEWTWGNRLPMPAEILEKCSGELPKRQMLLGKCEMALKRLPKPVDDGPKRDVQSLLSKAIAGKVVRKSETPH